LKHTYIVVVVVVSFLSSSSFTEYGNVIRGNIERKITDSEYKSIGKVCYKREEQHELRKENAHDRIKCTAKVLYLQQRKGVVVVVEKSFKEHT